jgi:hypothetical protein
MQIALGDDPKGADRRQRAALGAIDLVHTVTLPDRPTLASTWEVEILREYVARVTIGCMIEFAAPAAASAVSIAKVVAIAVI